MKLVLASFLAFTRNLAPDSSRQTTDDSASRRPKSKSPLWMVVPSCNLIGFPDRSSSRNRPVWLNLVDMMVCRMVSNSTAPATRPRNRPPSERGAEKTTMGLPSSLPVSTSVMYGLPAAASRK